MKIKNSVKLIYIILICFFLIGGIALLACPNLYDKSLDNTIARTNDYTIQIYTRYYKNGDVTEYTAWNGGASTAPVNNGNVFSIYWYEDEGTKAKDFGSDYYANGGKRGNSSSATNISTFYMRYTYGGIGVRRHGRIYINHNPEVKAGESVYVGARFNDINADSSRSNSTSFYRYEDRKSHTQKFTTSPPYGWESGEQMSGTVYISYRYCYGLKFDGNGNTGGTVPSDMTYLSGVDFYMPSSNLERAGYTFKGWARNSNATEAEFSPGSRYSDGNEALRGSPTTTLYAVWQPNTYRVTAYANNGEISETRGWSGSGNSAYKDVVYKTTYGTMPSASRYGYYLTGWYTSSTGGSQITDYNVVDITDNLNVYAHWAPYQYTITAFANGGVIPSTSGWSGSGASVSKNVNFDNSYGTLPTPTRIGYTFDGWYTSSSGGTKVTSSTILSTTGNKSIYAHWTAKSYRVTANLGGGYVEAYGSFSSNNGIVSKAINYNSTYGTLPTVKRSGYYFTGWYTASSGGSRVESNTVMATASASTIYAHWSQNIYKVVLDYNGGTYSGSGSRSEDFTYGTSKTFPVPTKTGYDLIMWTCSYPDTGTYICNDSGGLTKTVPYLGENGNSVTFTAQWSAKPYTLTYNANGGTTPVSTSTVGFGDTYGKKNLYNPALCILDGPISLQNNIFTINSNNTGSGTQWANFNQRFSGSFARNTKYTVVYECLSFNGSSFGITLTSPDDEGTNGNTDISNTGQSYVSVNGVGVYTTSFTTKNSFNLSNMYYDLRSYVAIPVGSNVSATVRVSVFIGDVIYNSFNYATYGNTPSGNVLPTPTRTGYNFTGWYTATSGGSLISNSTTVTTAENHIIYAHWSPKTFYVNFYANGGSGSMNSLGVTYDGGAKSLTNNAFKKENYIFKCWNTSANGSGTTYYENQQVSNLLSNIDLYAQWEETWNAHASQSLSGSGTTDNPYKLTSEEDLAYISRAVENGTSFSGVYFKQINNIELGGKLWKPIGSSSDKAFKGNYDGNGFWIKNLTTSSARVGSLSGNYLYSNVGLFGYTSGATLKNINILNGNVYGNSNVGAIAGYVESISAGTTKTGSIEGCRNRADVYGISSCGMIGTSIGCDIISCLNYGDITAYSSVGGIVGYNRTEKIKVLNSLACCQISGSDSGGIIGYSSVSGSEIISCGFKGSFKANDENQGLIAGQMYMGKLIDCLALTTMTGKGIGTNGTTISNCIYNDGSMHKIGTDFSNWSELASGLPLPKGLAWIGYVGMGIFTF